MKNVIVIGAVSQNGVYGEGDIIPWYIPEDFRHFKELTTNWTVVMGRGTWESLPAKFRPLPHRENIVITNTPNYVADGARICASVEQAIEMARTAKVFCIGGAHIWYHAMSLADEAWITVVKRQYKVTPQVTRLAHDLLRPFETWPDFYLAEVKKPEKCSDDIPPFEICHWVK
jgi:dihydrofolate reductase